MYLTSIDETWNGNLHDLQLLIELDNSISDPVTKIVGGVGPQ